MAIATTLIVGLAAAFASIGLGGGLYEMCVVDPAWPRRLDIIQPERGGVSRRAFWIPTHLTFEPALIASLVIAWPLAEARKWLFLALASHAVMRIWSAFDFIPKALAFERADAARVGETTARNWTTRSRLRLPLDVVTSGAMLAAFAATSRTSI